VKHLRILIILTLLSLPIAHQIRAQEYAAIWGRVEKWWGGPEFVLRFEVIDSVTHIPIKNARITFKSDEKSLSLKTDVNGIGIIMIIEQYHFTSGNIEITAPNYHYWEMDVDYGKYHNRSPHCLLYITGMLGDWTYSNRPSLTETINAVRHGNYKILRDIDYIFSGPGCFEYTVEMEKIQDNQNNNDDGSYEHRKQEEVEQHKSFTGKKERSIFVEDYYYDTEWKMIFENGEAFYIKFQPGKLLHKNDVYLDWNSSSVNWWIEGQRLIINLGNYNKLTFELKNETKNFLVGINARDNKKVTLEKLSK
jgi:hypothetical protein